MRLLCLAVVLLLVACSPDDVRRHSSIVVAGESVEVYAPEAPSLFVISLHGYGENAVGQAMYDGLSAVTAVAYPNAPMRGGVRQWASASPIGEAALEADDLPYLAAVVDSLKEEYPSITRVVGHGFSNGGSMMIRAACESTLFSAVVTMAGTGYDDPVRCERIVPVLDVYGSEDSEIPGGRFPSGASYAPRSARLARWHELAGGGPKSQLAAIDISPEFPTTERAQCGGSVPVEAWTIMGAMHKPALSDEYARRVMAFFEESDW